MKAVRIRTKSGELRICGLGGSPDLPAWWMEAKALGCIVGKNWGMPFDEVALADVIEIEPPSEETSVAGQEARATGAIAAWPVPTTRGFGPQ